MTEEQLIAFCDDLNALAIKHDIIKIATVFATSMGYEGTAQAGVGNSMTVEQLYDLMNEIMTWGGTHSTLFKV